MLLSVYSCNSMCIAAIVILFYWSSVYYRSHEVVVRQHALKLSSSSSSLHNVSNEHFVSQLFHLCTRYSLKHFEFKSASQLSLQIQHIKVSQRTRAQKFKVRTN